MNTPWPVRGVMVTKLNQTCWDFLWSLLKVSENVFFCLNSPRSWPWVPAFLWVPKGGSSCSSLIRQCVNHTKRIYWYICQYVWSGYCRCGHKLEVDKKGKPVKEAVILGPHQIKFYICILVWSPLGDTRNVVNKKKIGGGSRYRSQFTHPPCLFLNR